MLMGALFKKIGGSVSTLGIMHGQGSQRYLRDKDDIKI